MKAIRQFLKRVRTEGHRRPGVVRTVSMGRERTFEAYDIADDTFIMERGVASHLAERPSVLIVDKSALRRKACGRVLTVSTGNHSIAAFPLLDGRFWRLSALPAARRGETLLREILCANIVDGRLEISQREITVETLVRHDTWLQTSVGLGLETVEMSERNDATLEYYRRMGQEWRVRPLAWTEREMRVALMAAKKRITTKISYYHSARGVHWLTFQEFARFAAFAETDPQAFFDGLRELVGVFEGNRVSYTRQKKYRGHHEIEFFGVRRGVALEQLVPEIERLSEAVALGRIGQLGIVQKAEELVELFRNLLAQTEFADESSKTFTDTLYMFITGEVYAVVGEGATPAFDDRRTALPGATFIDGRPVMHPGADVRTEVLLSNLRGMMSKDEIIEYANVYELRGEGDGSDKLGTGSTREVVYKSSMRPLDHALVEKRLSSVRQGYPAYMLARIGALRSLGVTLSDFYLLLKRRPGRHLHERDHYIRHRCEGEPMEAIPAHYFRRADGGEGEDVEVVLSLAALMGDAASQNLAMKKFDPKTKTPLFGVGKEIYEFEYDIQREAVVPKRVSTCSIRGSFGWPCLDYTDENLDAIGEFYLTHFSRALSTYACLHPSVDREAIARRFWDGFDFRTRQMAWHLSVMRDRFEAFNPDVPRIYAFQAKWNFVMWALERQNRRAESLKGLFLAKYASEMVK